MYHSYFEGKLVSYALNYVFASCHRGPPQFAQLPSTCTNPKRMTLSTRPTSKKFRTSRARKMWPVSVVGPAMIRREMKTWEVYNPWKLRWNQKSPSWKGKSSSKPSFVGSMLICQGVCYLLVLFRSVSLKWWLKIKNNLPKNGLDDPNLAPSLSYHVIRSIRFFWRSGNEHLDSCSWNMKHFPLKNCMRDKDKLLPNLITASHVFGAGGNGRVSYSELALLKSRNTIGSALELPTSRLQSAHLRWSNSNLLVFLYLVAVFVGEPPQHFHTTLASNLIPPQMEPRLMTPKYKRHVFFFRWTHPMQVSNWC